MNGFTVKNVPPITATLGADVDAGQRAVRLGLALADGNNILLTLPAHLASNLILEVTTAMSALNAQLPEAEQQAMQPMVATGITTAVRETGKGGLVIILQGGIEMFLDMSSANLRALSRELDDLADATDPAKKH